MKRLNLLLLLLAALPAAAQKLEQTLDYRLRPDTKAPYYYSVITRNGDRWHRELYYLSERSQAASGDFLDSSASIADGEHLWYGTDRRLSHVEHFVAGKKQGIFLRYSGGALVDSSNYENGWRKGLGLGWDTDGYLTDSTWFDGAGNGRVVSRYRSGVLSVAGRYVRDTARDGRWVYYHDNGKLQAEVQFADNKPVACQGFNPDGTPGDPSLCVERDAEFGGGRSGWGKYLMKELRAPSSVKPGTYTVRYRFVVNTDGSLANFEVVSSPGRIFDQEVLRLLKASPKWKPAVQFGRYVKAYRVQPVTFMISE